MMLGFKGEHGWVRLYDGEEYEQPGFEPLQWAVVEGDTFMWLAGH